MSWLSKLLGRDRLPTLETGQVPTPRLLKAKQNEYRADVVMMFQGQPLRKFKVTIKAGSHGLAKEKIKDGLTFKVYHTVKKRADGNA